MEGGEAESIRAVWKGGLGEIHLKRKSQLEGEITKEKGKRLGNQKKKDGANSFRGVKLVQEKKNGKGNRGTE